MLQMYLELNQYQKRALDALSRWFMALQESERKSIQAIQFLTEQGLDDTGEIQDIRDYPKKAWESLGVSDGSGGASSPYVGRTDSVGRPIPHVCLNIPTGGGKTLLGVSALERFGLQTGLVLWITPTRMIYEQTRRAFRTRVHPYRQRLEMASGGRVKLLEKDDRFTADDVAHYLCVMLLMLPAANREQSRDFLRMFRESGKYHSFFPVMDDVDSYNELLCDHPDLDQISERSLAKQSLFNLLKILRPTVVLDEAHRAYGRKRGAADEFARSINRLNPRLVLELSATPIRNISNVIVRVSGQELKNEEMIKLPVKVTAMPNTGWENAIRTTHEKLAEIAREAEFLSANIGRYIRPMAVVRVERTGKDQRDGKHVHAEDVRDFLIQKLNVHNEQVAVKSATKDELSSVDLLSKYCQIRWVITKAALMEGWDCPFAYVLTLLDEITASRSVTQLVGRILRQPHARRTGREALDQCYVYCRNTRIAKAVDFVRQGLEQEGLSGLGEEVHGTEFHEKQELVTVERRKPSRRKNIQPPKVLHKEGKSWRELDHVRDILPTIDWNSIKAPRVEDSLADIVRQETTSVDINSKSKISYSYRTPVIDKTVKPIWFARRLTEIVPNSWQAYRIAQDYLERLRQSGETIESIYDKRIILFNQLQTHVEHEIDKQAEASVLNKLRRREIRLSLDMGHDRFKIAQSYDILVPKSSRRQERNNRRQEQLSLLGPIFDNQSDSKIKIKFAHYRDEMTALRWWYRFAARQGNHQYVREWKDSHIWPDFVVLANVDKNQSALCVHETERAQLDGSDTGYKESEIHYLQKAFECGSLTVRDGPAKGKFKLVFNFKEYPSALPELGK